MPAAPKVLLLFAPLLVASAAEPLTLEGAQVTPPPGFVRLAEGMVEGTGAFVPSLEEDAPAGRLLAAWAEPDGSNAATLTVGVVDRPLRPQAARRNVSQQVAAHVRGELGLEVTVGRAELFRLPGRLRLEVRAELAAPGGVRVVRFAFVPAGDRYFVLAASIPEAREAELQDAVTKCFEEFAPQPGVEPPKHERWLRAAAFAVAGGLLVLALRLWALRKKQP